MSLPASIDLTDRVAIVTGGSRGIGKGISLELARRGASVSIIYSNPARLAQAQETVSEIKSLGVKAVAIIADLKDPKSHAVIVKETLEGLGAKEIHILGKYIQRRLRHLSTNFLFKVHNAGQANTTHTPDMTPEVLSEVLDTNFCGPYLLTQAVLPYIPRGGRIIFISSISARYPTPGDRMRVPLYAASKAAVEALCREWAFEVRSILKAPVIMSN